ncbi:MAG: 30S ribosomal protein S5 [Candidatus Colwellbacteria bacterium]|nr:30S ribosomal protein S5 [Candidatus Colwellbacteria bacterium]
MRTPRARFTKNREEFKNEVLDLRRVTRVTKGGKRMSFRATVVIGDEKGSVGIGVAKGADVIGAIDKAKRAAKKNMTKIKTQDGTIPHSVESKFGAARVIIKPAVKGHGLMAGGAPRVVLRLLGINDITAKCLSRTKNKLTNALATMEALKKIK